MYKINNEMYPSMLNDLYKKNSDVHAYNTGTKDVFCISLRTFLMRALKYGMYFF